MQLARFICIHAFILICIQYFVNGGFIIIKPFINIKLQENNIILYSQPYSYVYIQSYLYVDNTSSMEGLFIIKPYINIILQKNKLITCS